MGHHFVQGFDHVVEDVWLDLRGAALAAEEGAAKVVQALLAAALFADQRVDVEPEQNAFVIEIDAAAPAGPVVRRA